MGRKKKRSQAEIDAEIEAKQQFTVLITSFSIQIMNARAAGKTFIPLVSHLQYPDERTQALLEALQTPKQVADFEERTKGHSHRWLVRLDNLKIARSRSALKEHLGIDLKPYLALELPWDHCWRLCYSGTSAILWATPIQEIATEFTTPILLATEGKPVKLPPGMPGYPWVAKHELN